ncbi:antibiotic synthesis protein MbtH [Amycolatopsis sp. NBRC 101858]|uniref:MbtH family protein n=1 Tax=Amycolatopsis sp. NBRC 101858 TaxID=3032200 RepID=UPI0024A041D9|nr:MbtH family NRPS accessory protein [Amycolatopsis sp. NBRC 101858]GLY43378.1 antibiotic synthesis protein MbtH [Amycolatopsis sp. NBRC 101858]
MDYVIVVDAEDRHSLLPESTPVPAGWRAAAVRGSRQDCLDRISEVWTDIRPASIRRERESERT